MADLPEALSPDAWSTLLHMLGLDACHRDCWRNHYVDGHHASAELEALVAAGLVEEVRRPGFLPASDRVYMATERGKNVARVENNRRNPPPSRARARYLRWLNVNDAYGISFGEYLRRGLYVDRVPGGVS